MVDLESKGWDTKFVKIEVSKEQDAAFAVVDIDTLWRRKDTKEDFHWKGRVCKIYTKKGSARATVGGTEVRYQPGDISDTATVPGASDIRRTRKRVCFGHAAELHLHVSSARLEVIHVLHSRN